MKLYVHSFTYLCGKHMDKFTFFNMKYQEGITEFCHYSKKFLYVTYVHFVLVK